MRQLSFTATTVFPCLKALGESLKSRAIHAPCAREPIGNDIAGKPPTNHLCPEGRMYKVAMLNRKGGCGKTMASLNLGSALARMGHPVVLCDGDPQQSLTQTLLTTPTTLALHPAETLAGLYNGSGMTMREIVRPLGRDGYALIAGHQELFDHNHPRPWERGEEQFILRDGLAEIEDAFSFCIVDAPPHIQLIGWSILAAVDAVVIPTQLEETGVHGIAAVHDMIDLARQTVNPNLVLLGILPTMVKKTTKLHATFGDTMRAIYGDGVFANVIPEATQFPESVTANQSVMEYKPKSAAAKAVEAVAVEMLQRIDASRGGEVVVMGREGEAA